MDAVKFSSGLDVPVDFQARFAARRAAFSRGPASEAARRPAAYAQGYPLVAAIADHFYSAAPV